VLRVMVEENGLTTTYRPDSDGKCPHCKREVHFVNADVSGGSGFNAYADRLYTASGGHIVYVHSSKCPSCQKPVVAAEISDEGGFRIRLVHPFGVVQTVPKEVPAKIAEDFLEAAAVLQTSKKASAALSRRCLQHILSDMGAQEGSLSDQIDWFMKKCPSKVADNLDYVRHIGNFAAHPEKSKATGEIVEVGPEEADWNLEVLQQLFDYCYV
jgi:endogenous inhibitor of DNA gyrase (YacG/DUF329 family)